MTTLGDITAPKVEQSGPPMTGEFTYVDISSIDNRAKRIIEPKRLPADTAPSRARQRLAAGDVLVSMTRPNLNAVALVPSELDGAIGSTGFHVLRANESTEPRWLYYAVQNRSFVQAMSEVVQGALYPAVRPKDIRGFEVDPPPLPEQRRIVAEIEKQFSRLDEAVAGLQRVKANLKRYKAAVLKSAVAGRLVPTEADLARREGRDYETGTQLLQRILETRRSQWQGKGKYKEPAAPDITDLPELPEGWAWANCDAVVSSIEAGASFKCIERPPDSDETGVLKVSAVSWGIFDEMESKTCSDPDRIEEGYLVSRGDFLFSRANTIDLVGASVIVHRVTKRLMLSDKTLRFKIASPVSDQWLLICLRSKLGRDEIERLATGNQESMRNIGQDRIRQIRVPLPPLPEQHRIVAEVDRLLSIAREAEAEVDANLKRAQGLRQAVLARAFQPSAVPSAPAFAKPGEYAC